MTNIGPRALDVRGCLTEARWHQNGHRYLQVVHLACRVVAPDEWCRRTQDQAVTPRSAMGSEAIVVQHLTVARVADGLRVPWDTAKDEVLTEGKRTLGSEKPMRWTNSTALPPAPGPPRRSTDASSTSAAQLWDSGI